MKKIKSFALLVASLFVMSYVYGCATSDPESIKSFELTSSQLDLTATEATQVPYNGKSFAIEVKATSGVEWNYSIKQGTDFITMTNDGSKKSDGTITVVIAKNETYNSRQGQVEVTNSLNDNKVIVDFNQVPLGTLAVTITPKKDFTGLSSYGEEIEITITTDPQLPLTYVISEAWIEKDQTRDNTWIIHPNSTSEGRTGQVSICHDGDKELDMLTFEQQAYSTLKFAVFSDLHFNARSASTRIPNTIAQILQEAPAIKAIFLPGDLTNSAWESEYDGLMSVMDTHVPKTIPIYYTMGNHDWYYTGGSAERFKLKTRSEDIHNYIEIQGFPFITISMTSMTSRGSTAYNADAQTYLKTKLEYAAEKFPGKPIFVFYHAPVRHTIWGTDPSQTTPWNNYWGSESLEPIMDKYPQAIAFSGHTHYTIRDERSIQQKNFTSVHDGGSSYGVQLNGLTEGNWPEGFDAMREFLVVEVKPNLDIQVKRMDATQAVEIKTPWVIEAPHDGSKFKYTDARTGGAPPQFAADAEITISNLTSSGCTISFPQATDDDVVFSYRVEVTDKDNMVVEQYNLFSRYWMGVKAPQTLKRNMINLTAGGEFQISVKAEDSFGMQSSPLQKTVSLEMYEPTPGSVAPKADWIDVMMVKDGAVNMASATLSVTTGSGTQPPTAYDNNIRFWASSYDGGTGTGTSGTSTSYYRLQYMNNDAFKTAITSAFTVEVYCKTLDGGDRSSFSSMNSGGLGFRRDGTGNTMRAHAYIGSGYKYVPYPANNTTDYYHYLFTYDGATMSTYLNGDMISGGSYTGSLKFPSGATAQEFVVGGDASSSGVNCQMPFKGDIAFARVHGKAVSRDEAYRLYEQVTKRNAISKFDELNTALTVTIPAMADGSGKTKLLEAGWALMNNVATTETDITTFLNSLTSDSNYGKPGGDLNENDLNSGGAL